MKIDTLVIVYVKSLKDIQSECVSGIHSQEYTNFNFMIHEMRPLVLHKDSARNKSMNVTRNRNQIIPMALASGAEWICFVDSDVVIPKNTISDFKKFADKNKILGGWYSRGAGPDWVAAQYTSYDFLTYYQTPIEGLLPVDLLGIGCSFMHRSLLEKLNFRTAEDEIVSDYKGNYYRGNCLSFCDDARAIGVQPTLVGSIICKHIK